MSWHQEIAKKLRLRKNTDSKQSPTFASCFGVFNSATRHCPRAPVWCKRLMSPRLWACTVLRRGVPGAHLVFGGFSVEFPWVLSHGLLLLLAEPALQTAQAAQVSCPWQEHPWTH